MVLDGDARDSERSLHFLTKFIQILQLVVRKKDLWTFSELFDLSIHTAFEINTLKHHIKIMAYCRDLFIRTVWNIMTSNLIQILLAIVSCAEETVTVYFTWKTSRQWLKSTLRVCGKKDIFARPNWRHTFSRLFIPIQLQSSPGESRKQYRK